MMELINMAEISEQLRQLYENNFKKIPCLNDGGCNFHKEILDEMKEMSFKLDEMANKYEPLLKTVLVEFDNHRRGISLILKGLGYPVDEIKGWDINTWEKKENVGRQNSRKSNGILRRSNDLKKRRRWFKKNERKYGI